MQISANDHPDEPKAAAVFRRTNRTSGTMPLRKCSVFGPTGRRKVQAKRDFRLTTERQRLVGNGRPRDVEQVLRVVNLHAGDGPRVLSVLCQGKSSHLVATQAAGHTGDDQRPHQTGAVAHPNHEVWDTLALVLVNLTSVCWLPGTGNRPQTVRSRADDRFH
jgi:hypothetical protein